MKTYQHFATVLAGLLGTDTAVRLTANGYMPLSVEDIGQSADGNRLIAFSLSESRALSGRQIRRLRRAQTWS
jgi:hypothetical protein